MLSICKGDWELVVEFFDEHAEDPVNYKRTQVVRLTSFAAIGRMVHHLQQSLDELGFDFESTHPCLGSSLGLRPYYVKETHSYVVSIRFPA